MLLWKKGNERLFVAVLRYEGGGVDSYREISLSASTVCLDTVEGFCMVFLPCAPDFVVSKTDIVEFEGFSGADCGSVRGAPV
jgi:hypothetical protein